MGSCRVTIVGVLMLATGVMSAATIANPDRLNLLEWYGDVGGTPMLLTEPSATWGDSLARNAMDGGYSVWGNVPVGAKLRFAMPKAATVDKFYIIFGTYGQHPAGDFTIRYSDTIDWNDAGWATAPSVVVTGNGTGFYTSDIADTPIRFVELTVDAIGPSGYTQVAEFMLIPPASATINADGRNILADPYTSTGADTYINYWWGVWDNGLNPVNAIPNGPNVYWQVDLEDVQPINVVTFSTYPGQANPSVSVYVSTDGVNFGSPVWTGANVVNFREAIFPTVSARYVKVVPADVWAAMNDIHVFYGAPCQACGEFLAAVLAGLCNIEVTSFQAWKAQVETLITDTVVDNLCSGTEEECEEAIRASVLGQAACEAVNSILDP